MLPRHFEYIQYPRWQIFEVSLRFLHHLFWPSIGRMYWWWLFFSVNDGYVDKSGVALTAGGGTLVLGSHDSVRDSRRWILTWLEVSLYFYPRSSALVDKTSTLTVTDPFSYIVHNFPIHIFLPPLTWILCRRLLHSLRIAVGYQSPEFLQWLACMSFTFAIWVNSLTSAQRLWSNYCGALVETV